MHLVGNDTAVKLRRPVFIIFRRVVGRAEADEGHIREEARMVPLRKFIIAVYAKKGDAKVAEVARKPKLEGSSFSQRMLRPRGGGDGLQYY